MAASTFTLGYGSSISYAPITSGTVGTYVKIAQSKDLATPMQEVTDINITNNDSPSNTKEYAPGMIEPGELEFDVVYVSATYATIKAFVGNGLIYSFKETFSDGSTEVFPGYWKQVGLEGKTEDEALMGKLKLKPTGLSVYTAPTGH